MKNWKHSIIGILAIIALALAFTACDDGNGKDKKDPCPCTIKVHYDTPCDCVGVGNDCDCTVFYKPALADVFTFRANVAQENRDKINTQLNAAFNEIWGTDPQLLLDLAAKTGTIEVRYISNTDVPSVTYNDSNTSLTFRGDLDVAYPIDFVDQLRAELIKARDDPNFEYGQTFH